MPKHPAHLSELQCNLGHKQVNSECVPLVSTVSLLPAGLLNSKAYITGLQKS